MTDKIGEKILEKLAKVRDTVGVLKKDGVNPYLKSKYVTLNAVKEATDDILKQNNLYISQIPFINETGNSYLETSIIDTESREMITSRIPFVAISDMQRLGSAITYARRYALICMLNLETEDDDGEGAVRGEETKQKAKVSKLVTKEQIEKLKNLKFNFVKICDAFKLDKIEDLTFEQAKAIIDEKTKSAGV